MEVIVNESDVSKDDLSQSRDSISRKESPIITDHRFVYATMSEKQVFDAVGMVSSTEKMLDLLDMERQNEQKKEKLQFLLKQFDEREGKRTHRKMLYRFRAVVRVMMVASSLMKSCRKYDYDQEYRSKKEKSMSTLPEFNVSFYMRKSKLQIPQSVKRMLSKPAWLRTEDEVDVIYHHISLLPFFDKYQRSLLRKMAAVMHYCFVDKNRVILRQGHMPMAFYFILSGALFVFVDTVDQYGQLVTKQAATLKPGASFGEIALILNTPRTASVTTKYNTELLSIDKDDFDILLKDTVRKESAGLYQSICSLSAFKMWSKEQMDHLSQNCKIVRFSDKKVILGDVSGYPEAIYFILDGRCRVVESLRVITASRTRSTPFCLQPVPVNTATTDIVAKIPRWASVVQRFLHIFTLEIGQFFGVGEDLQRRYVISWGQVECLRISYAYLFRNGHKNWLELLRDRINAMIPNHRQVFQEFVQHATWRAYKKDVMNQVVQKYKKPAHTKLEDVPVSIRNHEDLENWNTVQTL